MSGRKRKYSKRLTGFPELQPDYCPVCRERKSIEEWIGTEYNYDPTEIVACATCRANGKPPKDPLPPLSVRDREVVRDMLLLGSPSQVAKKHGLNASTVQAWFSGKKRPELRRALQIALEREGLDLLSLVRMGKMLLAGTKAQWNRGADDWDFFPDNMVRYNVWRQFTKLHGVEPQYEAPETKSPVAVFVQTNLGSSEKPAPRGTYTVEVPNELLHGQGRAADADGAAVETETPHADGSRADDVK